MNLEIDPDLKYCPQCRDEYRAEIERCATCGVELLSGRRMLEMEERQKARMASRSMTISPDDELVDIRKGTVIDIKQLQSLLEKEGIPALAVGDPASCGGGCCGTGLILRVRMEDARDAAEVLSREYFQSTRLADHDISYANEVLNTAALEATCPACGCRFSTRESVCPDCGLCFF